MEDGRWQMENSPKLNINSRKVVLGVAIAIVAAISLFGGAVAERVFGLRPLDRFFPRNVINGSFLQRQVLTEEAVTVDIAKNVSPAVVTIAVSEPERRVLEFDPFGGFRSEVQGGEHDIATGFIVDSTGLIVK